MDTLKIALSSKAPRPSRARNPVGCLLRRPLVLPTLSPRNISRLIYFSAARGGPRERSRAVLFHEGNARVDKRKVMGYNSWGNLFAPERRRALGPIFIETFPSSHIEIPLPWTKAVFSYCAHPDTACLAMEKRFLRFPAILLRRTIGDGSRTEGWVRGNARGLLVISRALLLRGPASSGWNVQARLSSLQFVVRHLLER